MIRVGHIPFACIVSAALLVSCSPASDEPPPPDPCFALRAEYEAVRTRVGCATETECVFAPGIGRPPDPGRMGDPSHPPCGSATHVRSLDALEDVVERWQAAACGPVGEPGSTRCSSFNHGARLACFEGRCAMFL
jgi:hypothetical protein